MREILFRGKPTERFADFKMLRPDLFEGDWVYGSLIVCDDRYYICTYAMCSNRTIINNAYGTMVEVRPETVGQYTEIGIDSENPGEFIDHIYEGDIIEFKSHGYFPTTERGVVVYHDGGFVIEYTTDFNRKYGYGPIYHQIGTINEWHEMGASGKITYTYERIGNIHDNPELLKGE